jgi:hypothetical protein
VRRTAEWNAHAAELHKYARDQGPILQPLYNNAGAAVGQSVFYRLE